MLHRAIRLTKENARPTRNVVLSARAPTTLRALKLHASRPSYHRPTQLAVALLHLPALTPLAIHCEATETLPMVPSPHTRMSETADLHAAVAQLPWLQALALGRWY